MSCFYVNKRGVERNNNVSKTPTDQTECWWSMEQRAGSQKGIGRPRIGMGSEVEVLLL